MDLSASDTALGHRALAPTRTARLHQDGAGQIRRYQNWSEGRDLRPGLRRDEGRRVLRQGRGLRLLRGPGRVARLRDRQLQDEFDGQRRRAGVLFRASRRWRAVAATRPREHRVDGVEME